MSPQPFERRPRPRRDGECREPPPPQLASAAAPALTSGMLMVRHMAPLMASAVFFTAPAPPPAMPAIEAAEIERCGCRGGGARRSVARGGASATCAPAPAPSNPPFPPPPPLLHAGNFTSLDCGLVCDNSCTWNCPFRFGVDGGCNCCCNCGCGCSRALKCHCGSGWDCGCNCDCGNNCGCNCVCGSCAGESSCISSRCGCQG
mmetsp:Transcript_147067/g.472297  ORF Transcript_147067/g.472297 Transcript_147067/m.472297 type:complete len:203 (+) Transcript_147067:219-827(+)